MRAFRQAARRSLGWAALVLALLPALASGADPGAPTSSDYPGMRTGALHFTPPGALSGSIGVEFLPGVTNELAGLRGDLLRAPMVGLRLGLAEHAEFQVSWPAQAWMWIQSQQEPPILGRRLGGMTRDFGDVTVTTLIRLRPEGNVTPAYGLRFAAKLPNSNEQLGIGDNSTDIFASALLAKSFASRATIYGDLGLGILTEPTRLFQQNDVLTFGFMSDYWAGGGTHLLGEVVGHVSTHPGGPGTASSTELRGGIGFGSANWTLSALLIRGLAPADSHGLGCSVNVSMRRNVFRRNGATLSPNTP